MEVGLRAARPKQLGLARRKLSAKPKARLVTVVWGEAHVSALIDLAWRTLLAPGNLPALAAKLETSYALHINEADVPRVINSPQFKQLSSLVKVEIHTFKEEEIHENRYFLHWQHWQKEINWAKENGAIIFLIIPDVLYFDTTLSRWVDHILSGKRAIYTIGTWVCEETFVPELNSKFPLNDNISIALDSREGTSLVLKHLHPIMAAALSGSGHTLFHFDRSTEGVPSQGVVSRIFTSQPLAFDPSYFRLDHNKWPLNRFEDISYEDVCILSTGPMLHVMEFYHGQPPFTASSMAELIGWSRENMSISHTFESQFSYHYRRSDIETDENAWRRADAALDHTRKGLLAVFAIGRLWEYAQANGLHWCCNVFSVGLWKYQLHRWVDVERDYTVFLPVDTAFQWSVKHVSDFLAGRSTPDLVSFARAHLVPKRLYLRPGDYVVARDADNSTIDAAKEIRTHQGQLLEIIRGGSRPDPKCAQILYVQKRVGFGVVYVIDRLLA